MIIGNKLSEQKGEREKRQPCSCANGLLVTKTKRKWKLKWLLGGIERGGVLRGVWLWLLALWFVMFLVVNALLGLSASRCYDGGVPLGVAEAGAGRAVWHHAQVFSATGGAAGHVDGASPVKRQETAGETGRLGPGLVAVSTAPRERAQILAVAVGAPAPTARAQVGASPVVRHGSDHMTNKPDDDTVKRNEFYGWGVRVSLVQIGVRLAVSGVVEKERNTNKD